MFRFVEADFHIATIQTFLTPGCCGEKDLALFKPTFIKLIFSVIQCSHATVSVFNTNFVQNINGKKLIAHCKEYM